MDFSSFSIYKPKMEYRRFGKTNKMVSVITLGGMRYKHANSEPRDQIPSDTLDQCRDTVQKALKTDYIDFYAWHGINNMELLTIACAKGGPVEELLKLKQEGVIGHIGFNTHGPLDIIMKAIETDMFDFVNLHYYYFFQRNKAAIDLAASKDMGVFIISPNDKGGQLFNAPQKLIDITSPLHPIQWNARFCLGHASIHTLTFGLTVPAQFEHLNGIFPAPSPMSPEDEAIRQSLEARKLLVPFADFDPYCMENDPSGLNIPEILRFRTLWKCYGMKDFGVYRYNMFQEKGHFFPGNFPTEENLKEMDLTRCPSEIPLVDLIRETHEGLYRQKKIV